MFQKSLSKNTHVVNCDIYIKNINLLLTMPRKKRYNKDKKIAIGIINDKEIYTTEFLMAKQLGFLDKFQGHSELKDYLQLVPFLFTNMAFDDIYKNINNNRVIYSINENSRKIFHIVDGNNFLVSVFVVSEINFKKQLNRRFEHMSSLNGGTATSHILSPARPFWRHSDLIRFIISEFKNKIKQEGAKK